MLTNRIEKYNESYESDVWFLNRILEKIDTQPKVYYFHQILRKGIEFIPSSTVSYLNP